MKHALRAAINRTVRQLNARYIGRAFAVPCAANDEG